MQKKKNLQLKLQQTVRPTAVTCPRLGPSLPSFKTRPHSGGLRWPLLPSGHYSDPHCVGSGMMHSGPQHPLGPRDNPPTYSQPQASDGHQSTLAHSQVFPLVMHPASRTSYLAAGTLQATMSPLQQAPGLSACRKPCPARSGSKSRRRAGRRAPAT